MYNEDITEDEKLAGYATLAPKMVRESEEFAARAEKAIDAYVTTFALTEDLELAEFAFLKALEN